jgi:uncharacterized protein
MYHKEVDQYIDDLPEELQEVAEMIRTILFRVVPDIEEKFSFKIPFYHYYGMFCYLTTLRGKRLHLSFIRGKDLASLYPQLEQKGRAMAASISFGSKKDLNKAAITELITTAAVWQKEAFDQGEGFVKRKKK